MKKLLAIIVLGLLWNSTSFAFNGLKGINQFELIVQSQEKCGVTKFNIENSAKYILSNSKIKIDKQSPDILFIDIMILKTPYGCFSFQKAQVFTWRATKNSSGNEVLVPLMLWETASVRKDNPDTFARNAIGLTESQIKQFIVAWSEQNK